MAGPAAAQNKCSGHLVCPAGSTYTGAESGPRGTFGVCEMRSGLDYISHELVPCNAGETLDQASGTCRPTNCGGGGASICRSQPVCPAGSTYTGSDIGPRGAYGICETRSGLNYIAHELVPCPTGYTLDGARGVCQWCPLLRPLSRPPIQLGLPDLVIERSWIALVGNPTPVSSVRRGQPYYACFVVANRGAAASGPFRVAGGGLGLTTNPYQDQAGLAPGATRQGCLYYPTTPQPGAYKLGLMADSLNAVHESNKANNSAVIAVVVTP